MRSVAARVPDGFPWASFVWAGAAVYAALLSIESVREHDAFNSAYDLAHYDQLLWLLSQASEPFSTVVTRHMLADHFQPTVALLTPVYWLGFGLPGLLAAQSIALALTAPALYALARTTGASPPLASVPSFLWLLCPWVAAVNLFDFHPLAFLPLLLALSVLAAIRERYVLLALTTVLALGLKEDVALTYVAFGLLLTIQGAPRVGRVLVIASGLWFIVAYSVVQWLGASNDAYGRRFAGDRGESFSDAVEWMLSHPAQTLSDVADQSLGNLFLLFVSTLFLALFAPSWILLSVPTAAHNALSGYVAQHELYYHYHVGTMTVLFIAAAIGVHRLPSLARPGRLAMSVIVTAAVYVAVWDGISVHREIKGVREDQRAAVRMMLERIPDTASVSASHLLVPHLSQRAEIYSVPEPFIPVDWGSSLTRSEFARRAERVQFVAYRDGDAMPSGGYSPPTDFATFRTLVTRLGFVEVARAGPVHVLERRGIER